MVCMHWFSVDFFRDGFVVISLDLGVEEWKTGVVFFFFGDLCCECGDVNC